MLNRFSIGIKSAFDKKLMALFVVIVMIIVSCAMLIYYMKVYYDAIEDRKNIYMDNYRQACSTLDTQEARIRSVITEIALDRDMMDYMMQSNSIRDYFTLHTAFNRLQELLNMYTEILSIYVHCTGENRVMSSQFGYRYIDELLKGDMLEQFYADGIEKKWYKSKILETDKAVSQYYQQQYATFITRVPLNSKAGAILLNLNLSMVSNNVKKSMKDFVLLDADNDILAFSSDEAYSLFEKHGNDIFKHSVKKETNIKRIRGKNENYYTFTSERNNKDFQLVAFVPYKEVTNGIKNNNIFVCVIIIFCLAAALCLFKVFRKVYMKPMDEMDKSFRENLEELKEKYISNLLTGKIRGEEICLKAQELNVNFDGKKFMVVVFQINNYYNYLLAMQDDERYSKNEIILKAIKSMFFLECVPYIVQTEFEKIAILVETAEDINSDALVKKIIDIVKYMQKDIKENCNLSMCVGISGITGSITDVHRSYAHALTALNHKSFYGKESVMFYEELELKNELNSNYPLHDIGEVIGRVRYCISKLDTEMIEQSLDKAFGNISSYPYLSSDLMNAIFANILYSIVKLVLEYRYTLNEVFEEDIFVTMYSFEFFEDKRSYLISICKRLISYKQNMENNVDSETVQRIHDYVHNNYDKDISLIMLADNIGMSVPYLSMFFKKRFGIGFANYINELRLKKAEAMLKAGNKSIKEIAEVCGYGTIHSFIRNFKKSYEITPSEYRERYLKDTTL